jgi:hypothetical protein
MKQFIYRGGPFNSVLTNGNDSSSGEASPVPRSSQKKAYKPPMVIEYGNVARLTAGANGTDFDPGHITPTKRGFG